MTAGTLFHSTNLPLTKWFWAIYLIASDKGGVSALRLSKQINVSWITASKMLRKIRIAMQQVSSVNRKTVSQFVKRHLSPDQCVRSDALPSLAEIGKTQKHAARVTPPSRAGEWLPWVHIAIRNLKAFLLGTYHGVSSGYLQEYLNEFCYRFNRRACEAELTSRLFNACLSHTQIKLKIF